MASIPGILCREFIWVFGDIQKVITCNYKLKDYNRIPKYAELINSKRLRNSCKVSQDESREQERFWWVLSFDVLKWLEGTMFNVSARFVNPKDFPEVFYYAEAPWTVDMVYRLRRILVRGCIGHTPICHDLSISITILIKFHNHI